MKVLKITTLVENHVTGEGLGAEHGLSLLLEVVNKEGDVLSRHLFDTGQGDLFAKNAAVMNIDLRQIDSVFISHGHYDHAGGLDSFLKLNQNALVYIKESALIPKHNGSRFTGFRHDNSLSAGRLFFVKNPLEIYPGLFIMPEISIFNQSDTSFINGDLFEDELYVAYNDGISITVISGCSHRGISNIIRSAEEYFNLPVHNIVAGLHTNNASENRLLFLVDKLSSGSLKRASLCHCTGIDCYCYLKNSMKDVSITYNSCGSRIYF